MILLCGGEKGGCGKSTLATNIAVHLATQGADVVLVDTDSQPTSARFIERRNVENAQPEVHCVQRTGDVSAALRDLSKRYQIVIVDAGGRDSKEFRTAAAVANLLLTPIKASQADLETLPKVNELVGLARGFNPDLQAYAVLCMAPNNPAIKEVGEAQTLLTEFDQLKLAATVIRDRKVYRDALLSGLGVVEMDNAKAKVEIQNLAREFFE